MDTEKTSNLKAVKPGRQLQQTMGRGSLSLDAQCDHHRQRPEALTELKGSIYHSL